MKWISLILSSVHSNKMQKNTPSSQVYMEHSPGKTISWVTNQTSVNLRKLKSYQASSNHDAMRLDINYGKKTVRNANTWRLNNTFLNNPQVTEEIKKEIKKFLETNDNSKPMGCSKSSSKREVYTNTILPQETRITSKR